MMVVHHGKNTDCPAVREGKASHCPGHEVPPLDLETVTAQTLSLAYGRGFRRCFELMRERPSLMVLFCAGAYDELRPVLRNVLAERFGPHAAEGWDSYDIEK